MLLLARRYLKSEVFLLFKCHHSYNSPSHPLIYSLTLWSFLETTTRRFQRCVSHPLFFLQQEQLRGLFPRVSLMESTRSIRNPMAPRSTLSWGVFTTVSNLGHRFLKSSICPSYPISVRFLVWQMLLAVEATLSFLEIRMLPIMLSTLNVGMVHLVITLFFFYSSTFTMLPQAAENILMLTHNLSPRGLWFLFALWLRCCLLL